MGDGAVRGMERKAKEVKRRGGYVCVGVVGMRRREMYDTGRGKGAGRKPRCKGEEMHAGVVVQGWLK